MLKGCKIQRLKKESGKLPESQDVKVETSLRQELKVNLNITALSERKWKDEKN